MGENAIGWRVQLCTGVALASMACAAVRVDILNNAAYGLTVSAELATILVLAAAGIIAIPTAASILGWSRHLRFTLWICVVLTVWSAANAYSARQGAAILAAQTAEQKYEAARADEEEARKTLDHVSEVGDAGELADMKIAASAKLAQSCRKPHSEACTSAEAEVKSLTLRQSDAKARDAARAAMRVARSDAKVGPAEASMLATVIAGYVGTNAANVARYIAIVLTGLSIAVTQMVALLGGQAARLIAGAIRARQQAIPRSARQARTAVPAEGTRPPPVNVVHLNPVQVRLRAWLESATVAGSEMRGGDALKAYKRHAGRTAADMTTGEFRQHMIDILGSEAIVARNSGYVVRGLELRSNLNLRATTP